MCETHVKGLGVIPTRPPVDKGEHTGIPSGDRGEGNPKVDGCLDTLGSIPGIPIILVP